MSAIRLSYDEIFEREWFKAWLDELATIVRASGKELNEDVLRRLRDGIEKVYRRHRLSRASTSDPSRVPVREIAASLDRAIKFLKSVESERSVIDAVTYLTDFDYEGDFFPPAERLSIIIRGLEAIAAIPSRRTTRGRPINQNLYELVHRIASLWKSTTG